MQEFYNKALSASVPMVLADVLSSAPRIGRSHLAPAVLADEGAGVTAYTVGSSNLSCFNKLFKEEYACTPRACRAAAAQDEQPAGSAQETAA